MRTFCNRNTFCNRYRHKKVRIFGKFAFFLFLCILVRFYIVVVYCFFALTKIQSNYYRTNFFCLFLSLSHDNFRLRLFIRNFAPQPDEEAGSAEEQPASNMAVPALEAVFKEPPRPWAAYCIQMGFSAKKT